VSVITAVPQPALASVGLTVTGAPATVTLYRTDEDGNIATVRGSPFTTSGGAVATVDHEAPFGLLTYSTTDPAGVDAVSVTLTSSTPWVTSPAPPYASLAVAVVDDERWSYPPRVWLYDVLGRDTPVPVWYPRSSRSGTLLLAYPDTDTRDGILEVLAPGAPILVRYPPGSAPFLSGYYAVGETRLEPLLPGSTQGVVEVDYVLVLSPPGEPSASPGWAWRNVPTEWATWDLLVAAVPTWDALVVHVPAATSFGV